MTQTELMVSQWPKGGFKLTVYKGLVIENKSPFQLFIG